MISFFRFVDKRAIYGLGIISLAHAPVHGTDIPIVNVHVDELSSARIWQHKLCATLSANVNINYRLPIKDITVFCLLRQMRIEIFHGSQNVFWVLHGLADISKFYPPTPMFKLKTHSGFHDLFLNDRKPPICIYGSEWQSQKVKKKLSNEGNSIKLYYKTEKTIHTDKVN